MPFPTNFVWGTATAAYQVEGAHDVDGRAPSVWDALCRHPGAVKHGESGDDACDHYHRFRDDVALLKRLGAKAYRLSISWSRVLPEGTGKVNEKGVAFYSSLIDELLGAGITPFVTLFHWDYPSALYQRGGWLNRDSAQWFGDYATLIAQRLGDRVKHWMTHNEPHCFVILGHQSGVHAPGVKLPLAEVLLVAHHSLLAHGRSVQALRASAKAKSTIGWAPVGVVRTPASDSAEDIAAARADTFAVNGSDLWCNTWFSDPVCLGHYPEDGLRSLGRAVPKYDDADMKLICQPLDFYGVNIYHSQTVRAAAGGKAQQIPGNGLRPQTAYDWPVTPEALYWGPKFLYERYKLPIYVTENGMSCNDWVALDGHVHDPQRIDFANRYLRALRRAMDEGVDVRGYFHWSFMDNFEWAEGYKERFGLVYVDFNTQERIPMDSFEWYRRVIATNGSELDAAGGAALR
jgi:beta-glucosidase